MQLFESSNRSPSPQALTGALNSVVCDTSTFVGIISTSESSSKQRYDPIEFLHSFGQIFGCSHSLMSRIIIIKKKKAKNMVNLKICCFVRKKNLLQYELTNLLLFRVT